ncbi:uncharacterized protein LOC110158099 isoform X2 [Boleophthalmus pectinirostris]|uniref:uncharacterized protein LOC110158099 isoform X2 n=1 Tax=Boleophthalmus pectinirostris TaxID=150288 RepID=UPI00242AF6EA|nr:uncharacterized protein LOC110158099 isoform X2 [Boleophthalmus pectinirostris]
MGCCSVTQRHSGVDEVGPDEIELLELPVDNLGVWSLGDSRLQLRSSRDEPPVSPPSRPPPRCPSVPQLPQEEVLWDLSREELHHRILSGPPIRGWEGQPAQQYGDIIHSSLLSLYNKYTQGILPVSGVSFVSLDSPLPPYTFELSSPVIEPKIFLCASAAELLIWKQLIEERRQKSLTLSPSSAHCVLSYLLPCDEQWKREELKKYLLHAPIWEWEGPAIQHMGQPTYLSVVHIINPLRQGLQERLMVLFPQDVLLLSLDHQRTSLRYEGRLPRHGVRAVERSAQPGRLQFELTGELVETLQVSCTCLQDYQTWMFHLQQPDRSSYISIKPAPPPIKPKQHRSRTESQEPIISEHCHLNGHS